MNLLLDMNIPPAWVLVLRAGATTHCIGGTLAT